MGLLLLLGLIVMYALGPQRANVMNYAYGTNYSDTYFFGKQLTSVLIAVVAFLRFILHRTNGLLARDQNTFFTLDLRYVFYYFSRARYFICRLRKKLTARIDGFIWED